MNKQIYLTKTLFALANKTTGCHRKLYYQTQGYPKREETSEMVEFYLDNGKAVGALARGYFPSGRLIAEKDPILAVQKTKDYLTNHHQIVLFEAAFIFEGCYVRTDILVKQGQSIRLIEVKSKSIKESLRDIPNEERQTILMDLAFQTWVTHGALGDAFEVIPAFHLIDATYQDQTTYRDLFVVSNSSIELRAPLKDEMIANPILKEVIAIYEVKTILQDGFEEEVQLLVDALLKKIPLDPLYLGKKCRDCEFKVALEEKRNGFKTCWQLPQYAALKDQDLNGPSIFDIGYSLRVDPLIQDEQIYTVGQALPSLQLKATTSDSGKRQITQATKLHNQDLTIEINAAKIKNFLKKITYPLYFLDFEAAPFSLPIFPNYRPNQKVIFQYSIHKIDKKDGQDVISHHAQFIDLSQRDPTIHLIRSLYRDLGTHGSVFMYSHYENTCLNDIEVYLDNHAEFEDRETLVNFIHSLTYRKKDQYGLSKRKPGKRALIDLCEWVRESYLDPATKGSVSIKKILPSMIKHSGYLQTFYGQKDLYGKNLTINSHNYENVQWIVKTKDGFADPYQLLINPLPLEEQASEEDNEDSAIEINNVGLALIAYAKVQNEHMDSRQIEQYREALLKYCELDTLAMVMVYQTILKYAS
jgi:hypothetical protein